jgi:tetratricopeptide (TPR) repeat protein
MEAAAVGASNTPRDARGSRISGASARALDHFEDALSCWQSWTCDPHAAVTRALDAAPEFVMALVLEAQLHLCSRDPAGVGNAHAALARARLLPQNGRERMHLAVIATQLQGEIERSRQLLAALLGEYPRDAVALTAAHALDHFLGDAASLRERVAAVMPHWSSADTGYHALLAMLAFGQEECGDYDRAGDTALRALAINPYDIRAHHAYCHVLEMQAKPREGLRWMGTRATYWTGKGASSTHVWWHLALYHLQLGSRRHALTLYDRCIAGASAPALSELIDASALLWRLQLRGVDPGARWQVLAERWEQHAEDAFCAFNDLHAMLAFVGARRDDCAWRLLQAQLDRLARGGSNRGMIREVGLPACQAIAAFGAGDYLRAAALLRSLPEVSHRLGGSHAQRGLIGLTLDAALQRMRGRRRAARRPVPGVPISIHIH